MDRLFEGVPVEIIVDDFLIYGIDRLEVDDKLRRVLDKSVGGTVASWLVSSTPDRAVRVRALAGDIVLYSWARHSTLTVPLSTQVYKWVPVNLMLGVTLRWTSIPSRG